MYDHRKNDKYIYLNFVVELIKALDHDYTSLDPYNYDLTVQPCNGTDYISFLEMRIPTLHQEIDYYRKKTEEEIEEEINSAYANCFLCKEEKESFVRNITIMREYRINRAMNKAAYYNGINYLAQIIHDRRIAYVSAPLLPIYFHIFHSVQGALSKRHPPMQSTIDMFEKNEELFTRLTIN